MLNTKGFIVGFFCVMLVGILFASGISNNPWIAGSSSTIYYLAGRVGIGVDDPVMTTNATLNVLPGIQINRTGNAPFVHFFRDTTSVGQLRATSTTRMALTSPTGGSEYFVLNTSTGLVGIGTISPGQELDVNGQIRAIPGDNVPACAKYTLTNNGTNWTVAVNGGTAVVGAAIAAATTQSVTLFALPAAGIVSGIDIKTTTAWSGTGFAAFGVTVGDSVGGTTFYTSASYDMFAAVSNTNFQDSSLFKHASFAGSNLQAVITADANLNSNTITGVTDFRVCWVAP